MINVESRFGTLRCLLIIHAILFTYVVHYLNNNYNIPRVCLLNRSSVQAMVLKSNRSGL